MTGVQTCALPISTDATGEAPGAGPPPPGTINLLVVLPEPVGDAALVNLLATATEAKVQALLESGVAGTGTASDAVCVVCPDLAADPAADRERGRFGGPRSYWGGRVARAVHEAVRRGAAADRDRAVARGWPRPPHRPG